MMEWLRIMGVIYFFIHLIYFVVYIAINETIDWFFDFFWHPKKIYDASKVNWFGAILIYFVYFIIVPIYAFISILIWLSIVGRK